MKKGVFFALFLLFFPALSLAQALTLKDCINEAIKKSPYLQRYKEEFLAEKSKILEEFSGFLPSFSIEGYVSRYMTQRASPIYERYKGFRVDYNIFEGGRTLFGYLGAKSGTRAYAARYKRALIDTVYRVVIAFYDALEKKELWKASLDDLKDAKINLDMATAKFREGLAPYADVIKAKARVAGAEFKVNERESEYWISLGNLNMEMGRPFPLSIEIKGDLKPTSYFVDFNLAKEEALKKNPAILEIEENLKKEKFKKKQIIGEFLPKVDFSWEYGRTHLSSSWENKSYNEWKWQLTFSLPIFSGFASRARLKRESALVRSLEAQHLRERLEVMQSVWEAFQQLKKNQTNVLAAEAHLRDAQHDLDVTRGRYKEGLATMVDLVTAQASLSQARAQYITSLAGVKKAIAALEKAIGKVPYMGETK